jgi:endonuclease YncB( thermonuclease family)
MKFYFHLVILVVVVIYSIIALDEINVEAKEAIIPEWVRNNALWWSQGLIDDADFISGMKYLIDENIMIIPHSQASTEPQLPFVPNWIKDTAGWWATKKVTDTDFVSGMEYLIIHGYMTTPIPIIECLGKQLCLTGQVNRIVDGDTLHVEGYKIRLSLSNTPETYEEGFRDATVFTESLCPVGSTVTVDQDDLQPLDKYQRILGKVICDGKNLNAELLYNGHATILTQYCSTSEFSNEDWAKAYGC